MRIAPPQTAESWSSSTSPEEQTRAATVVEIQTSASPPQTPVAPALAALSPRKHASISTPATASRVTVAEASSHQAPPTPSTQAGFLARAHSALATGTRQAFTGLSQAARTLWSISDLRTILEPQAHDPAFLQLVRQFDSEQATPHSLTRLRQATTQLRTVVTQADGLKTRFRMQALGDIKALEEALHPLEHGTPAIGRALKALVNLVNLWPLLVPSPFMANQAKTFAYSLALATKSVLVISASALRSTTDGYPFPLVGGGQMGRDANELHLYAYLLNGVFLGFEISKKSGNRLVREQAEAAENSMGFAAVATTACAAIMITPFLWNSISAWGNRASNQVSRLGASIAQQLGFGERAQQARDCLTPGQISAQLRTQLEEIATVLLNGRDAFQQVRRDFTDPSQGRELTRTLNAQCTHLLETIDQCCRRLDNALQHEQGRSTSIRREPSNTDIASKLSLALLGTGVTGSVIYLIQPDRIGTVDSLADTAVVTTVMLQSAFNKHANRQDAMERFKSMCGGSMVIAMALAAEKMSKTFFSQSLIETSSASPYYAGVVMSLMAMTMPGPVANGTELAMNWSGRQISRLFKGPDGTQLATTTPSSLEELQETTHRTLQYLMQLSPLHLQAYQEQIAPDAALQAMQDAGAAARRGASNVAITEIEEDSVSARSEATPDNASSQPSPSADAPAPTTATSDASMQTQTIAVHRAQGADAAALPQPTFESEQDSAVADSGTPTKRDKA